MVPAGKSKSLTINHLFSFGINLNVFNGKTNIAWSGCGNKHIGIRVGGKVNQTVPTVSFIFVDPAGNGDVFHSYHKTIWHVYIIINGFKVKSIAEFAFYKIGTTHTGSCVVVTGNIRYHG